MRFFTRVIVGAVAAVIIAHIEQPVVVGDISNATLNSSELNPGELVISEILNIMRAILILHSQVRRTIRKQATRQVPTVNS